jgi:hypothetical protein
MRSKKRARKHLEIIKQPISVLSCFLEVIQQNSFLIFYKLQKMH